MSAQSNHDASAPLPKRGSEEFAALRQALFEAVHQGDLATLQQAGFVTIAYAIPDTARGVVVKVLQRRHVHVMAWLVEESERTGLYLAGTGGWKPLHVAALQGDMDKLRAATDEELTRMTDDRRTALEAAVLGDQGEAVEYLMRERGLSCDSRGAFCPSALEMACSHGCVSAIEALVACGARLHDVDWPGEPCRALVVAAEAGQAAAMEKLVELGADISAVDDDGGVINAVARSGGYIGPMNSEAIDAAVRLGGDPRAVDGAGRTALHAGVWCGQSRGLGQLVEVGVPLDAVDHDGRTALHLASHDPETCRALLELGADRWIKDDHGRTARDHADSKQSMPERMQQVVNLLDTYFPILPSMAQLLLGLRGPTPSPLTRFAAHSAFEPRVLSIINCLLTGKNDKAFDQLIKEHSMGAFAE